MSKDNLKIKKLTPEELKVEETKLKFRVKCFEDTKVWWERRAAVLTDKIEKFNNTPGVNEEYASILELERKNLNIKSQWETRERAAIEEAMINLSKLKQSNIYSQMGAKFSNILPKQIPPSGQK